MVTMKHVLVVCDDEKLNGSIRRALDGRYVTTFGTEPRRVQQALSKCDVMLLHASQACAQERALATTTNSKEAYVPVLLLAPSEAEAVRLGTPEFVEVPAHTARLAQRIDRLLEH